MKKLERIIDAALDEDIGIGDITTDTIISDTLFAAGIIRVKEDAVVAGLTIAERIFKRIDPRVKFTYNAKDGDSVKNGQALAKVTGRASSLLKSERTALNFLMRLSGIATVTRLYVEEIEGTGAVLLDTRKTTPGLRIVEKYAVRAGGGTNHRFGLFDGILIKDNHIKAAGSIKDAVKRIQRVRPYHKVEVEVKDIVELKEAIRAGADIVLLDNMDLKMLKQAMSLAKGRVLTEVSGNITLKNIKAVARLGPDFISTGAVTHSAKAIDISMKLTNIYKKEME
jgi:nicotinate-nucleotide pyrophosphorylase (carboxylating)